MIEIVLLALGSAVFPALLGCVAILISRPHPRRSLLAFYLGGLITSLTCGAIVLALFSKGKSVAGNTTSTPHPGYSIFAGVLALVAAWLMTTPRGRAFLGRLRDRRAHPRARPKKEGPSWIDRRLDRASGPLAFAVGAVINLPGPFYLLALGDIATGDYGTGAQIILVLLFNAIMLLLLEVPLAGYVMQPEATAAWVAQLAQWLKANGLRVLGAVVGLSGVGLLVQGSVTLVS